ncbi:MAG: C40 family peptidase [Bacilli bacterium]|nr:C40 family peptidase [Bacilli bacterium]
MDIKEYLVEVALKQINKPYEHTKHGPNSFDCAGLVWYIYNKVLGIDIYKDGRGKSTTGKIMTSSYGTIKIYKENLKVLKSNEFKLGDILLFHRQALKETEPTPTNKYPGHCGIYIGNMEFIHCPKNKGIVLTNTLNNKYWNKKLVGKKNIIE